MNMKMQISRIISLAGVAWLGSAATATAGSELDTVRAKVRAKYPTVRQRSKLLPEDMRANVPAAKD